jgi:AmiR/NasT family two-component response regulator
MGYLVVGLEQQHRVNAVSRDLRIVRPAEDRLDVLGFVILDFDTVPTAIAVLGGMRKSPNRSAVVFTAATGVDNRDRALQEGAHFLLERPIDNIEIKRVLTIAHDVIHGSRGRHFCGPGAR